MVYEELRALAARRLAGEPPGQTLQATALVHEAWLKVAGVTERRWNGRRHFYAAAAVAMRRILIDQARRKAAGRHGGGWVRLDLPDESELPGMPANPDRPWLAIEEALDRFAAKDPTKAELVRLRIYGGLTFAEAAKMLGLSEPTAKRYWAYARAWLWREMARANAEAEAGSQTRP